MQLPRSLQRLLPSAQVGFIIAALVILIMGGSLFAATWKASAASRLAADSQEVLQALGDVELNLARAESAHRGYLLSGNASYLHARDDAIATMGSAMEALSRLTKGTAQRAHAREVAGLLDQRVDLSLRQGRERGKSGLDAGTAKLDTDAGEAIVARVLDITRLMEREELLQLNMHRTNELERRALVRTVVVAAMLLSLAVLAIAYGGFTRETRERLRVQRQLRDLAEHLPVTVYQYRTGGNAGPRFEFVSNRGDLVHGVSAEEVLRDPLSVWNKVYYNDRLDFSEAMKKAARDLSPLDWEYRVKDADGSIRWVRSCALLRREADGSILWNGYWADVTERKQLALVLERAKQEADSASRAKSTFLATMSHEIRTPMNGVLAMLELLGLSRLDREQRATLSIVRESGRSLLRIIDDILDFSKIEAGRLTLNPEVASVAQVLGRAIQIYSGMASSKGLILSHSVDERISPALLLDPLRLSQILNNFIANALKFTHDGSVEVSAQLLDSAEGRQTLRLCVKDTGIGIDNKQRQQLFQPFVQAERGTARRYGGTGLGLAICRRLAELMGGSVEMESAPGSGTTMSLTVSFPVADERHLPQANSIEQRERRLGALLASRRVAPSVDQAETEGTLVLVVDDHPTNRAVMLRQVATLGYAAESAEDGVQALQMWQRGRYAIILTDCNMPEMDGYELARRIRTLEAKRGGHRIPIIACTANALSGEAQACLDAGMDDYLAKPIELSELMKQLDRWRPVPATMPAELDALGASSDTVPLDRSMLAAISGQCADTERAILLDFRRVNDSDALMLRQAVGNTDASLTTRVSHRIKGASKMVGATRLADVCEGIEAASRVGDWHAIASKMAVFQLEMQSLNTYLDAI